jgi:hypothetical protein
VKVGRQFAISPGAVPRFMTRFEHVLNTCLDQVRFMELLVQPDRFRNRILLWAEEEIRAGTLPAKSGQVLEAVLFRGELPRGDVLAPGSERTRGAACPHCSVVACSPPQAPARRC